MKKWVRFFLTMVLTGMITQRAMAAEGDISVAINGVTQAFDQPPILINESTFVPLQEIFEALETKVEWNENTGTIVGTRLEKEVNLHIRSKKASVSGNSTQLRSEVKLVNDTAMVPVRPVAEALGMFVHWDAFSRTVFIDNDEPLYGKTKRQIMLRLLEAQPVYTGTAFMEQPHISPPHKPGRLNSEFIEDGVKTANFMRYLSGLPDDLVQSAELNEQAQYGATLLADLGKLTHTPGKPEAMEQAFYEKGYASTTTSNIYNIYGTRSGVKTESLLARAIHAYMRDEDDANIAEVGHRRWILNPPLKKIGFGMAEGWVSDGYNTYYSPMQVFDKSRNAKVEYDTITWPGKGYFPIPYFQGNDPWSISLNPEKFMKPELEQVSVKLVRVNDRTVWTMDRRNQELQPGMDFIHVDTNGYGVPYCIIFRPGNVHYFKDGDRFEVTVTGVMDKQGNPVELTYPVVFFETE